MADLDTDTRIVYSIGTNLQGPRECQFRDPCFVAFDHHRGLLYVVDRNSHRVQAFSSLDGSFAFEFGSQGILGGQFQYPVGIAIDHNHDRIFVTDTDNDRLQAFSSADHSFLFAVNLRDSFPCPAGVAFDSVRDQLVIVGIEGQRVRAYRATGLRDRSILFDHHGLAPDEIMCNGSDAAVDLQRSRIVTTYTEADRIRVFSAIDGSFLFEFGSYGKQPGQFEFPQGVCVDNHGRIIVADGANNRLQAFTHEGHHISSFDCGRERPFGVAFDEHRGLIAFSTGNRVHVIGANQWLADTKFMWRPDRHRYAPRWIKQAVSTMTRIRSLVDESSMSMIPNELLFEIFSFL